MASRCVDCQLQVSLQSEVRSLVGLQGLCSQVVSQTLCDRAQTRVMHSIDICNYDVGMPRSSEKLCTNKELWSENKDASARLGSEPFESQSWCWLLYFQNRAVGLEPLDADIRCWEV